MPGHIKKYSVRFSPKRIKKIMQKNTEVGRISMAVPVVISRALEIFLKSLLTKTCQVTQSKLCSVMSVAHMKQCVESEKAFHFLKELVEQDKSAAASSDKRGMSIWSFYRERRPEISVEKLPASGETTRRKLDSLDNQSSSSVRSPLIKTPPTSRKTQPKGQNAGCLQLLESELYICL